MTMKYIYHFKLKCSVFCSFFFEVVYFSFVMSLSFTVKIFIKIGELHWGMLFESKRQGTWPPLTKV